MAASFRLPADVVKGWKETLSTKRSVRGVEPLLKEILDVLLKEGEDAHVPILRHQVFSWTQALDGIALKTDDAALRTVAHDMRAYLGQGPGPGPGTTTPTTTPALVAPSPPRGFSSYAAPPPVVYAKGASAAASGGTRIVGAREIAGAVGDLVRGARTEILIVAPWSMGFDSIAKDVLALPPGVLVRLLTRRPAQDDPEYHRTMSELRRRNADVVVSNALHTRLLVADGARLLLGAAGMVPGAKETAVLTTDEALVNGAREAFAELAAGARG